MNFRHDDSPAGATAIGYSERSPRVKVLVVDDTKSVRDLIGWLLRPKGYEVLEAEDGVAAQMFLAAEHPALVISDLEMPVCDGWSVLTYCHAQHPEIPVLLISGGALGQRPEIERWAAGALPKPFSISAMRAEVERLVARAA